MRRWAWDSQKNGGSESVIHLQTHPRSNGIAFVTCWAAAADTSLTSRAPSRDAGSSAADTVVPHVLWTRHTEISKNKHHFPPPTPPCPTCRCMMAFVVCWAIAADTSRGQDRDAGPTSCGFFWFACLVDKKHKSGGGEATFSYSIVPPPPVLEVGSGSAQAITGQSPPHHIPGS